MKPGQYIVIPVADIEEKIRMNKDFINTLKKKDTSSEMLIGATSGSIQTLQYLLSNPTDLYDVVEDAYQHGAIDFTDSIGDVKRMALLENNYLNNLEI